MTAWQHFKAEFYNVDQSLRKAEAGYYLFGFDKRSFATLGDFVTELKDGGGARSMERRCENEVLCGIPHYHIYFTENAPKNYWIPVDDEPTFTRLPQLLLNSSVSLNQTRKRYNFIMKGKNKQLVSVRHSTVFF